MGDDKISGQFWAHADKAKMMIAKRNVVSESDSKRDIFIGHAITVLRAHASEHPDFKEVIASYERYKAVGDDSP